MLSFHGNPAIKAKYVARVKHHRELDNIIQGTGWENGKGCAVGCTLENYNHHAFEFELGIPEWLARVEDSIFEGLSNENAKDFPISFLEAIPVGIDLDLVKIPFLIFVVESTLDTFDHKKYPEVLLKIEKTLIDLRSGASSAAAAASSCAASSATSWSFAASAVTTTAFGR